METLKNKSIVVFEMNDVRKFEYGSGSGDSYKKPFAEFIESLGFEVESKEFISKIIINGHEFTVNVDNASYMSRNAWNRVTQVRKPINRFITLEKGGYDNPNILKLHFNKEYDADKLRAKINDAIQEIVDTEKFWVDKKNKDKENTIAISKHFTSLKEFIYIVSRIKIHEGKISFFINNSAILTVAFEGNSLIFVEYFLYKKEIKGESELDLMFDELSVLKEKTKKLKDMVFSADPLNSNIIEWATKAHERYYNVTKLEYDNY